VTQDSPEKRIFDSPFTPAWWLGNRHAQTIYPSLPWSGAPRVKLHSEPLELPDGDVAMVDWVEGGPEADRGAPLLIILHGLEGSARSSYARSLLHAATLMGWRAAVLHSRDCGDYRNRLPRRYHAGETNDIRYFVDSLRTAGHEGPMVAAGFSLGGSVLLKYLGENGVSTPLSAAAAICVPLSLHDSANARTFADFDDAVTAPLHGFAGKDEYYDRCSSAQFLADIRRPTLIINALDDPFMTPAAIPGEELLSEDVKIEVSPGGGHVGFIRGGLPWRPEYYLPDRIIGFLDFCISESTPDGRPLPGM
jgi:predicted alpha/beta-fold hydrolase